MYAELLVRDHFQITSRGAFLAGDITAGRIRIGDRASSESGGSLLTINAIEFADNISARESSVCLRFAENPSKETLQELWPVGSVIRIVNAA
jgi:hypothetical protein